MCPLLELISCSWCFICYILFCSPYLLLSVIALFCFIAYHCSVFYSSILMTNNFYAFNLSIFCHYILQFLYIHCIIHLCYTRQICFCLYYNLLFDVLVSHMHSILMVVLFHAYRTFQLFPLCLDDLFLFLVLG